MTTTPKEIRINTPTPFTGNKDDLITFILDCGLYFSLNSAIYNTDDKKTIFTLSYMTGGVAKEWKESYIIDAKAKNPTKPFGTYEAFIELLKEAFLVADGEGDARAKLRQLRQGTGPIADYISQFRIYAGRSKITEDKSLIEYFMEGLHPRLLEKIYSVETIPKTLAKWFELATRFDAHYHRVKEIKGRSKGSTFIPSPRTFTPRYATQHRDPNAMDIDRLTAEERQKHFEEKRCFNCHRTGHQARNCRSPRQTGDNTNANKYQGFKKTATTARAMIRSLVADMEPTEKEELWKHMESDMDF
jgi:hypothetical protein